MRSVLFVLAVYFAGCVPGPGQIHVPDEATACAEEPLASGAMLFESTDHVRHRLTGELVCPRGFYEMISTVREWEAGHWVLRDHRQCIRNERDIRCEDGNRVP